MPVTVDKPGFWLDNYMTALDQIAGVAKTARDQGIPADAMLKGDRYPLQPGRIDPNDFPNKGVAPMNAPNKAQSDADWINEIINHLDKQGKTVNVTGKLRNK